MDVFFSNKADFGVSDKPTLRLAPQPKRQRLVLGRRQLPASSPVASAARTEGDAEDDAGNWDGLWEPAASGGGSGGAAASCSCGTFMQPARVPHPSAAASSAEEQQKWDRVRLEMQRSYVQHLPGMRALAAGCLAVQRSQMEEALAAQQPACSRCNGVDMEATEPVPVLYLSTNVCFVLPVPTHRCRDPACGGSFAPSPFAVGCFPATPKAS